ncbi:MAG: hypothetical protein GX163_11340 [Bacteroidetes bacterium]|nr:hypothetical protein [Bacteroidota bacterium]
MSLIKITVVENPIAPEIKLEKREAYIPNQSAYVYANNLLKLSGYHPEEFCVLYNGKVFAAEEIKELIPYPNTHIIVVPNIEGGSGGSDSKKVLSTIVMIAIMYVAPQAGAWASNMTGAAGLATTAASTWTFWGYMAAATVMYAGSALASHINPGPKKQKAASPTYSWDGIQPLIGQGQPLPIILGKERCAGIPIAKHVITDGTKQYYNLLISAGEGPCDYTGNGEDNNCTGITNIKINGNPINNFRGVTVYKRAGLNNQSVIPNFENTRLDQQIGVELKYDNEWHTFTTLSNVGSGLELTFTMPALYDQEYKGTRRWENEVHIEIEYRQTGTDTWNRYYGGQRYLARKYSHYRIEPGQNDFPLSVGESIYLVVNGELILTRVLETGVDHIGRLWYEVDTYVSSDIREIEKRVSYCSIAGKYTSAVYRRYQINAGTVGQYDVRCRCVYKYAYGDEDVHTIYWSKLSHVVYDDFIHPNEILISIQALASEQISGNDLLVTFDLQRSNVLVYVPNDPVTAPYGEGTYQLKPANNPGWQSYWLNHRVYKFEDPNALGTFEYIVRGVTANKMRYNDFKKWADFCTTNGITCNIYLDTKDMTVEEALQYIEEIGRGRVRPHGTRIGCYFDGPAEVDGNGDIVPTRVYNVETIGRGSFSEKWVDKTERATALEIQYRDANLDYAWTSVVVPADGLNSNQMNAKVTKIELPGCTSRTLAWQHGKYRLFLNRTINNSVSIVENITAIDTQLGDIIAIQHSVPDWGKGGRVVSVNGTTVILNKSVTMETGKIYKIKFILEDDTQISREVVCVEGEHTEITLTEGFDNDVLPADYESPGLFSVAGDQTEKLIAGELVVLYHDGEDVLQYITSTIYVVDSNTTLIEVPECPEDIDSVRFAWTMPHEYDFFNFGEVVDNVPIHSKPYRITGFTRHSDQIYSLLGVNYVEFTGATDPPEINYSSLEPIFEVESLAAKEETFLQLDGTLVSQINASWILPVGKAADRFLVYYSEDGGLTWFLGVDTIDTKAIITNVNTGVEYLIRVVVFKELIYSAGVTSQPVLIEGKDTPPSDVKSLTVIQQENILKVTVIPPDDPDLNKFELRVGDLSWETSSYLKQFKDNQTTVDVTQAGTQTFWAKAIDNSGNYSDNAVSFVAAIYPISNKFTIHEEHQDGRNWIPTCMFWDKTGWQIDSVEKLGDLEFFGQMFDIDIHLCDDAEVVLGVVDLGETIIPTNYVETFLSVFAEYDASDKNYLDVDYRTSWDGVNWSEWQPLVNHQFNGRLVQPKLKPRSIDVRTNVNIRGVTVRIDVTAVTETIDFVNVADTGTTRIYLNHRFFNEPMPQLFSYASTGKYCTHEIVGNAIQKDVDGCWYFDIRLWDGDTQIAGKIGGTAKGY